MRSICLLLKVSKTSWEFHSFEHKAEHFGLKKAILLIIAVYLWFWSSWVTIKSHFSTFHDQIKKSKESKVFPNFLCWVCSIRRLCSPILLLLEGEGGTGGSSSIFEDGYALRWDVLVVVCQKMNVRLLSRVRRQYDPQEEVNVIMTKSEQGPGGTCYIVL